MIPASDEGRVWDGLSIQDVSRRSTQGLGHMLGAAALTILESLSFVCTTLSVAEDGGVCFRVLGRRKWRGWSTSACQALPATCHIGLHACIPLASPKFQLHLELQVQLLQMADVAIGYEQRIELYVLPSPPLPSLYLLALVQPQRLCLLIAPARHPAYCSRP